MVVGIKNVEKAIDKVRAIRERLDMSQGFKDVGIVVQRSARAKARVDTSQLKKSIKFEALQRRYQNGVIVYTNVEYAQWVEFGTSAPHFVPFVDKYGNETGIKEWAERHGIDTSKLKGLMVSGKPTPFMHPAFLDTEKKVNWILKKEAEKQIHNLVKGS